jgi:tripartite-type tricarboxylate transporter receptor subunit TctC
MVRHSSKFIAFATAALLLLTASSSHAQTIAEFYKSKGLTILVGSGAGGGYDVYARLLSRHWGRFIPGNPTIVVQLMPGAGGIIAHNHLSAKAARDGSVLAATRTALLVEPLLDGGKATKYDPRTDNWIGNMAEQHLGCAVWSTSPVKTLEDAMQKDVIVAASAAASNSATLPLMINIMFGTKFKVISGYGTEDMRIALERGEAEGICSSYATLKVSDPDWINNKKVRFLVQMSLTPDPNIPEVPTALKYIKNEDDKLVMELMDARQVMGRPFVGPPEIPADRLAMLRSTFMEVLKDPALLADAEKSGLEIQPSDHKAMEALIAKAYALPPHIIKRTADFLSGAEKAAESSSTVQKK